MPTQHEITRRVLDGYGTTYATEAGIRLRNTPAPLYQLSVLALLLSARIAAGVAVAAARELFAAGYRTPARMAQATWQQRVDALGRGHYRRYDERTSTMLGEGADLLRRHWRGDLRRIYDAGKADPHRALQQFPGIGPVGADIFLREAQAVWPGIRPYLDSRVVIGAERVGLATDASALCELVGSTDLSSLAAGLVRLSLDRKAAAKVRR